MSSGERILRTKNYNLFKNGFYNIRIIYIYNLSENSIHSNISSRALFFRKAKTSKNTCEFFKYESVKKLTERPRKDIKCPSTAHTELLLSLSTILSRKIKQCLRWLHNYYNCLVHTYKIIRACMYVINCSLFDFFM